MDALDPIRAYVSLTAEKRRLKAELEEVQSRIYQVERQAIDAMMDQGFSKISLGDEAGNATVYLSSVTRAKMAQDADRDEATVAIAQCEDPDVAALVSPSFNLNSVSRAIKDMNEAGEPLPEVLQKYFTINETPELRIRRK